jgi:hypothetical protein
MLKIAVKIIDDTRYFVFFIPLQKIEYERIIRFSCCDSVG